MATQMEQRRSVTAGAVAYLLLLAACVALIRPFVNAGISDDFGYIRSAKDFADKGRFLYYGAATPMLGWMVPLGALFIKLFGFSFTAPRIASFLIAAVNGILLQWILLHLGCNRVMALFGATVVLLSPASLPAAMLFFTDQPGLLAMLVTLVLCFRIVRAEGFRATQYWIAAAFLVSFLLGTVRQLLWIDTIVMVPSAVWLVRKRKGVIPWAAACFTLAGTIAPAFEFADDLRGYMFSSCELQLALLVGVDDDVISVQDLPFEDLHGEGVLHHALYGALQRTSAVDGIVARFEDRLAGGLGEFERDAPVGEQPAKVIEAEIDDVLEL